MNIKPHQRRVIKRITNPSGPHGILVNHEPGSGKTKLGLIAAMEMMKRKQVSKVWVTAPKSVLSHWELEKKQFVLPEFHDRIRIVTHAHLSSHHTRVRPTHAVIIDESHQFRNYETSIRSKNMIEACRQARKVLLLTGTPVVNYVYDLVMSVSVCLNIPLKAAEEKIATHIREKSWDRMIQWLAPVVDTYAPSGTKDFANVNEIADELRMDKKYDSIYQNIQDGKLTGDQKQKLYGDRDLVVDSGTFKLYIRRACNEIDGHSPKADRAAAYIAKRHAKRRRVVLYSQFRAFGIVLVGDRLEKAGIPFVVISGSQTDTERADAVLQYNSEKNDIHTILITGAGAEGVNLLKTYAVVFLEPFWHRSRLIQVIARGRRYKSHNTMPEKERILQVHHLILERHPDSKDGQPPTADEEMHAIISRKRNQSKAIQLLLQLASDKSPMGHGKERKAIMEHLSLGQGSVKQGSAPGARSMIKSYMNNWPSVRFGKQLISKPMF